MRLQTNRPSNSPTKCFSGHLLLGERQRPWHCQSCSGCPCQCLHSADKPNAQATRPTNQPTDTPSNRPTNRPTKCLCRHLRHQRQNWHCCWCTCLIDQPPKQRNPQTTLPTPANSRPTTDPPPVAKRALLLLPLPLQATDQPPKHCNYQLTNVPANQQTN